MTVTPPGPTGKTCLKTSECNCKVPRLKKQRCWICAYQSVFSAQRCGTEMRNTTADCGLSPSACSANFDQARCAASSTQNWQKVKRKTLLEDSLKISQPAKITENWKNTQCQRMHWEDEVVTVKAVLVEVPRVPERCVKHERMKRPDK